MTYDTPLHPLVASNATKSLGWGGFLFRVDTVTAQSVEPHSAASIQYPGTSSHASSTVSSRRELSVAFLHVGVGVVNEPREESFAIGLWRE
ncbi:hypothetical protein M378DRAFT_167823 [Amanita muscaria Koide BX008]|uniref:Uncharacterized protein n=1 Tax=Amanita muscaria (strain Koide BX008) TaxID=946122 RepID=A0A0C2WGX3_AMAMK|nr:hypothetical protein M378DRAFT_167823 [Amanita muscaria Koide BX008]